MAISRVSVVVPVSSTVCGLWCCRRCVVFSGVGGVGGGVVVGGGGGGSSSDSSSSDSGGGGGCSS